MANQTSGNEENHILAKVKVSFDDDAPTPIDGVGEPTGITMNGLLILLNALSLFDDDGVNFIDLV